MAVRSAGEPLCSAVLHERVEAAWAELLRSYDDSLDKIWRQAGRVRFCHSVEARLLGELKAEVDGALSAGTRALRALAPWARELLPSMTGTTAEELGEARAPAEQDGWLLRTRPLGGAAPEEAALVDALLASLPSAWGTAATPPTANSTTPIRPAMLHVVETVQQIRDAASRVQDSDAERAALRCRVAVRAFAGLQAHWKRLRHRGTAPWLSLASRGRGVGGRRSRSPNRAPR